MKAQLRNHNGTPTVFFDDVPAFFGCHLVGGMDPKNPKVLLAQSRTYYAEEKFDLARAKYQELATLDKALAEQFVYLNGPQESATRASDVNSARQQTLWAE